MCRGTNLLTICTRLEPKNCNSKTNEHGGRSSNIWANKPIGAPSWEHQIVVYPPFCPAWFFPTATIYMHPSKWGSFPTSFACLPLSGCRVSLLGLERRLKYSEKRGKLIVRVLNKGSLLRSTASLSKATNRHNTLDSFPPLRPRSSTVIGPQRGAAPAQLGWFALPLLLLLLGRSSFLSHFYLHLSPPFKVISSSTWTVCNSKGTSKKQQAAESAKATAQ